MRYFRRAWGSQKEFADASVFRTHAFDLFRTIRALCREVEADHLPARPIILSASYESVPCGSVEPASSRQGRLYLERLPKVPSARSASGLSSLLMAVCREVAPCHSWVHLRLSSSTSVARMVRCRWGRLNNSATRCETNKEYRQNSPLRQPTLFCKMLCSMMLPFPARYSRALILLSCRPPSARLGP